MVRLTAGSADVRRFRNGRLSPMEVPSTCAPLIFGPEEDAIEAARHATDSISS